MGLYWEHVQVVPLSALAHIETRPHRGEGHVAAMVRIMQGWPKPLPATPVELVLPPVWLQLGHDARFILCDGHHRLTAARIAGLHAVYAHVDPHPPARPRQRPLTSFERDQAALRERLERARRTKELLTSDQDRELARRRRTE